MLVIVTLFLEYMASVFRMWLLFLKVFIYENYKVWLQVLKKNRNTFGHSEGYWDQLKMKIFKIIYTQYILVNRIHSLLVLVFSSFICHSSISKHHLWAEPRENSGTHWALQQNHYKKSSHINTKRGHLSVPSTMAWTSLDCPCCTHVLQQQLKHCEL